MGKITARNVIPIESKRLKNIEIHNIYNMNFIIFYSGLCFMYMLWCLYLPFFKTAGNIRVWYNARVFSCVLSLLIIVEHNHT